MYVTHTGRLTGAQVAPGSPPAAIADLLALIPVDPWIGTGARLDLGFIARPS
jgi:hypothetical protein